jgi:hypothetical protein
MRQYCRGVARNAPADGWNRKNIWFAVFPRPVAWGGH